MKILLAEDNPEVRSLVAEVLNVEATDHVRFTGALGVNRQVAPKNTNLVARLGDSDVQGLLRLEKGDIPNLSLELRSDALRIAPLLEEADEEYEAEPEFDDGRVIPDIQMPFDAMRKLNASVVVDIGELQREEFLLSNVTLQGELQDLAGPGSADPRGPQPGPPLDFGAKSSGGLGWG